MITEFEEWLVRLNKYAKDLGCINCIFEDDEFTRDLFEDGNTPSQAFQELMRE